MQKLAFLFFLLSSATEQFGISNGPEGRKNISNYCFDVRTYHLKKQVKTLVPKAYLSEASLVKLYYFRIQYFHSFYGQWEYKKNEIKKKPETMIKHKQWFIFVPEIHLCIDDRILSL